MDGNASLTYQYDAEGRRVHAPTYESVYDLNGRATTLLTLSGMWAYSELYAGGRHLATYSGNTTNFVHTDWLGTRRVMTSLTGGATDTCTGLPFGDAINCLGTEWNFNRFTDDVHDSESTWSTRLSASIPAPRAVSSPPIHIREAWTWETRNP